MIYSCHVSKKTIRGFFIHDEFYRASQRVYSSMMDVKKRHNIMDRFVTNPIKHHKIMGLISNDADP
jgi:hypothetical protein